MFTNRKVQTFILFALFTLLLGSTVLADDGRINRAPYHFGGDTLFCTQETGCTILDKTGHEMAHWPQNDIATAFAASDVSGQNTKVNGEGQGTYGPMQLWSVSPDATTGNNQLCMIGFDEWGKQNNMCFLVTPDYVFEQAALPVPAKVIDVEGNVVVVDETDHSCDEFSVGQDVMLKANNPVHGLIDSIDHEHGTLVFDGEDANCSDVEPVPV